MKVVNIDEVKSAAEEAEKSVVVEELLSRIRQAAEADKEVISLIISEDSVGILSTVQGSVLYTTLSVAASMVLEDLRG